MAWTFYCSSMHSDAGSEPADDHSSTEPRSTRRRLLRLAGAATVGAAGASALAGRAAADTGYTTGGSTTVTDAVVQVQSAGRPGKSGFLFATVGFAGPSSNHPSALAGWSIHEDNPNGIYGYTNQATGHGVIGVNDSTDEDAAGVSGIGQFLGVTGEATQAGVGVFGEAQSGYGIGGRGERGALLLRPGSATPPPNRGGSFLAGTIDIDASGNVWCCVQGGASAKWRKLAGPGTGGTFHPRTPGRVYDSRQTLPSPGVLAAPATRTISVADRRNTSGGAVVEADFVPAGAIAVAANITVISVAGRGFLTVNPGGVTTTDASTINWSTAGQTLANGVILTLNTNRELTVVAGGAGASTNFIVDITGYWL